MSEAGLDGVGEVAGLGFELLQFLLVPVVFRAAGEKEQVVGLVPPGLEPVGLRRDRAVDEPLEPVELVA